MIKKTKQNKQSMAIHSKRRQSTWLVLTDLVSRVCAQSLVTAAMSQ